MYCMEKGHYVLSCGTQRVIPSVQDSTTLPARVANHRTGLGSSHPLTELAMYYVTFWC